MRAVAVALAYIVLLCGTSVAVVFAKPPLEFYYAQWVNYWESDRPWQCTGC